MLEELRKLQQQIKSEVERIKNSQELRDLEVKYLGRKGELTEILRQLKDLSSEEKQKVGKLANEIKTDLAKKIGEIKGSVSAAKESKLLDLTLPGQQFTLGHLHPVSRIQYQLEDVFSSLGFIVEDGPELESEFFNFEALNVPASHPARDMQDTFYIKEGKGADPHNRLLLRTQTSSVQVRAMKKYGVPLRLIVPGRVFRFEATDARHETTFTQIEGLMIDKDISVANLISVIKSFLKQIFGKEIEVRLRPGYFPFVEPGFEMDLSCLLCGGKGCAVCKKTGWVEFMGSGLVHPNVLLAGGVDPKEYSGFAFGFGLTRLVMMKYGIDDIRLMNSGDLRFLNQF